MSENNLKTAMEIFSKVSTTKEEAFLKGYLMGLDITGYEPNWMLLKNHPELKIVFDTEKDIAEVHRTVRNKFIEEAKAMLIEVYQKENRKIPE